MFDAMNNLYKTSTQGCEDANVRKHLMLLHKEISAQGVIRIHWRQCQRRRSIDYNFEWSSKFSQGSCSRRNITYGGMHVRRRFIDGKRRRDGWIWQSNSNNSCQEEKEQEERTFPQRIKGLQKKDISQLRCSVVMRNENLWKNVQRRKNGRMIWSRSTNRSCRIILDT